MRKVSFAVLTVILFGAFAFRLWNLGTQSLWHDEAWSVFSGYHPLAWGQLGTDVNAPPIFYMTLGLWQNLAGDSVWAMRCWSALLGVITVALAAIITRRWFGERVAVLTALLVAASPILWVFSQEIRAYVMMPLCALILLALCDKLLTSPPPKRRTWIWVLLIEIVTLYIHNLSVPIVAWLNIMVIMIWFSRHEWRRLAAWIAAQVGLLILYLPWLLTQKPTGTPLNTPPALTLDLLWKIWQSYFTGINAMVGADPLLMQLTAAFGVVAVIGIAAAVILKRSQRTLLLLSQAILLPALELGIILAAHIDFHPRYFIVGVPATLMLAAVGWACLVEWLKPGLQLVPLGAAALLAIGIAVRMTTVVYSSPIYQHDDFRGVAQHYAQLGPDDAIIVPYGWEPTLDYYSRKMNFRARFINIPLHADADTVMARLRAELPHVRRSELLTWYQLPADLRGVYPCLLGVNGTLEGSSVFSGIKTDRYEHRSIDIVERPFSDMVDFGGAKLLGMQGWSGTVGACVITQWQIVERTSENLAAAVRVLNPLGWEIARTDSAIVNNQQLPTSLWKDNSVQTAFSSLKLPDGTVSQQDHPVSLTLYSSQTPQGFDVVRDGKIMGKDAVIGTVSHLTLPGLTVEPNADDKALVDGLYLHSSSKIEAPLQPGQEVRLTLEWWQTKPESQLITVSIEGDGWRAESQGRLDAAPKVLTWHSLIVPAAAKGLADLKATALDGKTLVIGRYEVARVEHVFEEPTSAIDVKADFTGAGSLVGADAPLKLTSYEPFSVRLIWKAEATSQTAYTVFVHLLDSNGQVIAQSDAQPQDRPTTGWIRAEYVVDQHLVTFTRKDYTGPTTLEVGLYDPSSGKRVLLSDGADHAVLPVTIELVTK